MYRRETITRMQANGQGIIPVFHKTQHRNLTMMVIGIVMAKSVQLTKIAPEVAIDRISHEAYVQRFERLMACEKFDVREVMKAIATQVLKYITQWQAPLVLVMDRSMINDTLNLVSSRMTDSNRLQRLLMAVCLAYLWMMELGAIVVRDGYLYLVNSRGSKCTISLCLVGLTWVHRLATQGIQPQLLSYCFDPVEES